MASTQNTEDIAFLNSGRYLEWSTQETGSTTANGVPTGGVSGINVIDEQVVKLGVVPNSGATLSFRVWLEYEGLTGFKVVDGSDRSGLDYAWTQQINVSGAERIYVEVTSIDIGSFDVEIGRAVTLPNAVLRRRRIITDWSDLGTGIFGETVVYEDDTGNQAQLDWDATNSRWVLTSTNDQWVNIEDWSSGSLNTALWYETTGADGTVTYTVDGVNNRVELTVDSTNTFSEFRTKFRAAPNTQWRAEGNLDGLSLSGGEVYLSYKATFDGEAADTDWMSWTQIRSTSTSTEAVVRSRIDGTDEVGISSAISNLTTYYAFNQVTGVLDNFRPDAKVENTSSSVITQTINDGIFYRDPVGQQLFAVGFRNNNPTVSSSGNPWIGKIWVKR